mgnify:FL=1
MVVKKILLVDDELDIRESVKMLLETMNYEVEITDDGNNAITMLKNGTFDLVLLDILMPKISGIKTLEKIRADSKIKNQKVVFLTVVSPTKNGEGIIEKLGTLDYIEKPIDNNSFKEKIEKILGSGE